MGLNLARTHKRQFQGCATLRRSCDLGDDLAGGGPVAEIVSIRHMRL